VKRSHSTRPTRLSALLEQTLARFGLDRRLDDYRVWQAWDEVVGLTISRNAQPVRLDGSRLIVTVRSSTWLQELSLLQRELVRRLNEWMKRDVVHEIFFVVGRVEQTTPASLVKPVVRDAAQSSLALAPPASPGLSPEATEIFERLWRAARSRKAGDGASTHASATRNDGANPKKRS
jgi:hypothetical protein